MTAYKNFEKSVQKSMQWIRELQGLGGILDDQEAYAVLRVVLHSLRDRLTLEEGAQLADQLPTALRGLYYEGWQPSKVPVKYNRMEFLDAVIRKLPQQNRDIDEKAAISSVFYLLQKHISAGEIEDIKSVLPKDFEDLWPHEKKAA